MTCLALFKKNVYEQKYFKILFALKITLEKC